MTFEWTNPATLGRLDTFDKFLAGWFQGVTPRTAGFNTVDIGGMNEPTLLVITMLMFIGAGPASTAGGIKVTTFAVLGFVLWSEVRGNTDMNVFRRRLPANLIRQALTVALLAIGLVVGATLALMSAEDLAPDARPVRDHLGVRHRGTVHRHHRQHRCVRTLRCWCW